MSDVHYPVNPQNGALPIHISERNLILEPIIKDKMSTSASTIILSPTCILIFESCLKKLEKSRV